MSYNISNKIIELSKKYNVEVIRDLENCDDNNAACAGNMIFLGKFEDPDIELIAFFHELGHIESSKLFFKNGYKLCVNSSEGLAWELGLSLAWENGYKWQYNSKELTYARNRLSTYNKEEHFR